MRTVVGVHEQHIGKKEAGELARQFNAGFWMKGFTIRGSGGRRYRAVPR